MFELVGLNGAKILVNAKSVFRLRPASGSEDAQAAARPVRMLQVVASPW